jgi:hypothetical protein
MIKAANNDPVPIVWLYAPLGYGDKRDKRDKRYKGNDGWVSWRSSGRDEARSFVKRCHFVHFFDVQRATQEVQVPEWQWEWQQTGPQNLPFPATPGRRFSDLKHKSSRRLRSTASLKCPVAVRRITAIPDGDPSALGADLNRGSDTGQHQRFWGELGTNTNTSTSKSTITSTTGKKIRKRITTRRRS